MKYSILLQIFLISFSTFAIQNPIQDSKTVKRVYFEDSIIAVERWYNDNNKLDRLKAYYKSGELNEDFNYINGRFMF